MSYTAKDYRELIDMFDTRARLSVRVGESPGLQAHHALLAAQVRYAALAVEALEAADIRSDGKGWFTRPCPGILGQHCARGWDKHPSACMCIDGRVPLPRNERKEEGT